MLSEEEIRSKLAVWRENPYYCEPDEAFDLIEELLNQVTLAKAEAAGATGLLLDVQKECVKLRKELNRWTPREMS